MERILVVMDPVQHQLYAGIHALNLAKRISAKVLFLLIFPDPYSPHGKSNKKSNEAPVRKKVEALIEDARSEDIAVEYYVAYGNYERELVNFVQDNKVTMLVVECPTRNSDSAEAAKDFVEKLKHRINCRIEVVNEKPETQERKE